MPDRVVKWFKDKSLEIVDDRRKFVMGVTITMFIVVLGFAVAVTALVSASRADDRALERIKREAVHEARLSDERRCRENNVRWPQIAINSLRVTDGILKQLGADVRQRRGSAQAAVQALGPELKTNGSAGPRDCNRDGTVNAKDYPPGVTPPRILNNYGLPAGARP